ncbi:MULTISPECIES: HPr family phosphocarrier protein [Cupriavidus]|uniref:HPr family phosphocarrier protein n=1 Tax=Cupriavidus oxalaticus TaxID=96344 RepID=A0A4P7LJE1_9BURK|nr:HPr family phosphocarrier protein [Cupriavidus oxalaticus]MBF6989490.1 HPr family phosphocarrier protein [Cupriavidus sp. IK-TO18]QBY55708.1 HPr family phosphocarrier protein [Cupriavidus oxalaticus]
MVEVTIEVTAGNGFQGRNSARLAFTANQFECKILLTSGPWIANAKNVMEVMRLSAQVGTHLGIQADGVDEAAAVVTIAALLRGEALPKSR